MFVLFLFHSDSTIQMHSIFSASHLPVIFLPAGPWGKDGTCIFLDCILPKLSQYTLTSDSTPNSHFLTLSPTLLSKAIWKFPPEF